jgi:hypothetical protein
LTLKNFGLTAAFAVGFSLTQNAWGQPGTSGTRIGFFLSHTQELRPLYGLPSNVMLGAPRLEGAGEAAFSDSAGLVRVGGSVYLQTVASDSSLTTIGVLAFQNEVDVVLGISAGRSATKDALAGHAAIWLPVKSALAWWDGDEFKVVPTDPLPGPVVSVSPDTNSVTLMVQVVGSGVHLVVVGVANGQIISNVQRCSGYVGTHTERMDSPRHLRGIGRHRRKWRQPNADRHSSRREFRAGEY